MNPKIYLFGLATGLALVSHSLFAQLEDKRGIVLKGAQLELVKDGLERSMICILLYLSLMKDLVMKPLKKV